MLQLYSIGERYRLGASGTTFGSLEVGLLGRFEVGFDSDFHGSTTWNVKFHAFDWGNASLAAGIQDWSAGSASPYVVGKLDCKQIRIHAGWLKDDASRPMLGLDGDFGRGFTYMFDFVGGPGATTWGGLYWSGPTGLAFYASVGYSVGRPLQHSAGIYFYFKV